MNLHDQYTAIVQPSPFIMSQYRTPQKYLDPSKIIEQRKNMNYKHKSQGKFKPSKRQKQFYLDELIQPIKSNPSPCKYQTTLNLLEKKSKGKNINNVVKPNAIKGTYIDQIQIKQNKQKAPGIGKYNLLKLTDFPEQSPRKYKNKLNPQKRSYFDGKIVQTLKNPAVGDHNPHQIKRKLQIDRTDYKFYQEKHQKEKNKIKRSLSAKLGPSTYNPVNFNTFDSIKLQSKHKTPSRWTHGQIQIRKGLKSACKHPSPAQYQLINQWTETQKMGYRKKSQSQIGTVDLFSKTIKSARSLSVYRD